MDLISDSAQTRVAVWKLLATEVLDSLRGSWRRFRPSAQVKAIGILVADESSYGSTQPCNQEKVNGEARQGGRSSGVLVTR